MPDPDISLRVPRVEPGREAPHRRIRHWRVVITGLDQDESASEPEPEPAPESLGWLWFAIAAALGVAS